MKHSHLILLSALGFSALVAFAFWPLNPPGDDRRLPPLLEMHYANFPAKALSGHVFATNWDGDPQDDLVALSGNGVSVYRWNAADEVLENLQQLTFSAGAVALAGASLDWDADGDADLVIAHSGGLARYENRDGDVWPEVLAEWDIDNAWLALSDIDQNGELEITVASVKGTQQNLRRYNLHGQLVDQIAALAGPVVYSDIDNDQHPELIVAPIGKSLRVYRPTTDKQWPYQSFGGRSAAWSAVDLSDYDGDGDQDILAVSSGYFAGWSLLENTPEQGVPKFAPVNASPLGLMRYASALQWKDLNTDGLPDILASQSGPSWTQAGCCEGAMLLQVTTPGEDGVTRDFENADSWSAILSRASSVVSADFNGDGLPDIAAHGNDGTLRMQINRRDQNYLSVRLPQTPSSLGARFTMTGTGGQSVTEEYRGYGDLTVGLGRHWKSTQLTVRWADGSLTVVEQPSINQRLHIAR